MRAVLVCPSDCSRVPLLSQAFPLACVPLLGLSLLEYWLSAMACRGFKKVTVLAHEQPDLIRKIASDGERWGLEAKVLTESRELTVEEALLKYGSEFGSNAPSDAISVLDHFPGLPSEPLFSSYRDCFSGLRNWMPHAVMPDRVGINESRRGIWTGLRSHISPEVEFRPPCWIGQHVYVGAGAIIGPDAIIEDGAFLERGAEIAESWVGPDTFVGAFARINVSLAWGSMLVNWQNGSAARVADPFLLCALRQHRQQRGPNWLAKLADAYNPHKGEMGMIWKHLLLHKEG